MSEILDRYIHGKHHGAVVLNLMAGKEIVCSWTREAVDAYKKAKTTPDPAAPDVLRELLDECQVYTDAVGTPVLFNLVFMNQADCVVHTRPHRVSPSAKAEANTASQSTVSGVDFERMLKSLLSSNAQMKDHMDAVCRNATGLAEAAVKLATAAAQQKLEPVSVTTPVQLSPEETEALVQRTIFVKQLSSKAPEVVDLFIGAAAKYLKLGEGAELAAQTAARGALAIMNGKNEEASS